MIKVQYVLYVLENDVCYSHKIFTLHNDFKQLVLEVAVACYSFVI